MTTRLAERQGFEPWDQQAGQRFSRPPRSTTPASLLVYQTIIKVLFFIQARFSKCKDTTFSEYTSLFYFFRLFACFGTIKNKFQQYDRLFY